MSHDAVIAANRFGLGARPAELRTAASDPRGWLEAQVRGARELPAEIRALPSSTRAFGHYEDARRARRETRTQRQQTISAERAEIAKQIAQSVRERLLPMYLEQVAARYRVAITSRESFRERLVHFWTNHFAVSADKPQVLALAGTLENEAIRPNLARSFTDLLLAVEAHPAMILYLDNQASIGPHSTLAERAARGARNRERKLDINENLAREILELHTLGVNGGYAQADVTSFARALTGWSVSGARGSQDQGPRGTFEFREAAHEPGSQTLLGKRYGDAGVDQPRAILRDLAHHPATATHIATKLARHFVADAPPERAIARLAKVFRDADGDLPSLHAALVDLPEAWSPEPAKLKTPHEFVVSALRMLDFVPAESRQIIAPFDMLGQRPYTPRSPAGWPDLASRWDGPDALLNRIEWAAQIAERVGKRYAPLDLASASFGAALAARTRESIARAESAAQGVTLLLASPDFQRR